MAQEAQPPKQSDLLGPSRPLSDFPEVVNKPITGFALPDFGEMWRYRNLLINLVARELKSRYKQSILGIAWAVINPMITIVVFSFVFDRLAAVPSYDVPYPLFSFAGLAPWALFARGITSSATSIVREQPMVTKIYVPRMLIPLSKMFTGMVDFAIAFVVLVIMGLALGYVPTANVIWLPFLILLAIMTALGVGLFLTALHVRFRDIGQVVPYMVQIWMYLSPVAYPTELLQEPLRTLYGINPMVTVCDGFRWALLGIDVFHPPSAILSTISAIVILLGGMFVFRRMESTFPDLI